MRARGRGNSECRKTGQERQPLDIRGRGEREETYERERRERGER